MSTRLTPVPEIDLDALVAPVARVKLFGDWHDVLPANGRAVDLLMQRAQQASAGSASTLADELALGRSIVADCVPTLGEERLGKLGPKQLTAIVQLSTEQVESVQAMLANLDAPAGGPEGNGSGATSAP